MVKRKPHGNVVHGAYAISFHHLLDGGDPDARTTLGQEVKGAKSALVQHMGGEDRISAPEMILVDQAVKLLILSRVAWAATHRSHNFDPVTGAPVGAFDAYLRATRSLREVLGMLGLAPREIELTLGDILAEEQRK